METNNKNQISDQINGRPIIIEQQPQKKNRIGLAGFILALIALFTDWIPVIGWMVWVLGALFSIIGLFKKPRGFAIAGFIISFIGLILLVAVIGAIGMASV